MNRRPSSPPAGNRRLRACRAAALLALAGVALLLAAPAASAHPLGNFTVNRYTGLLVSPTGIVVDHVRDLAEIPTAQLGARVDDLKALADEECAAVLRKVSVEIDGRPATLRLQDATAATSPGEADLPVTRITCSFSAAATLDGPSDVRFRDSSSPGVVGWQEVTAVGDRMSLTASNVPESSVSARLTDYPADLLDSPPTTTAATLRAAPGGPAGELPGFGGSGADRPGLLPAEGNALSSRATSLLDDNGTVAAVLALGLALVLGASHALAPGHGKTVMAFYLSQRGGSAREPAWRAALSVGVTVTVAHTGSVLGLGLLVSLSATFAPARLYPWLTLAIGLLILGLGLSLLSSARRGGHGHSHGPGHAHPHGHGHTHGHGHSHMHGHTHGHDHPHDQEGARAPATTLTPPLVHLPPAEQVTHAVPGETAEPARRSRLSIAVMGLVGGLVPSPSALVLLLAAVALGRAWFGVVLVVAFGVGMAASLAFVGLVARDLFVRVEGWARRRGRVTAPVRLALTYGAASGVCVVGTVIVLRAVMAVA